MIVICYDVSEDARAALAQAALFMGALGERHARVGAPA